MSDVEEDSYEENTFDTDVEEDGDVEELANMLSKLQPYQYEPCNRERKSDGSESETTDNDSDTESDGLDPIETNCEGTEQNIKELKTKKTIREGNLDWCECLQCQNETREIDCLCCQEVAALNEKFDENSMTCITESTELQTLCLNTAVLKNVLTGLHDARGDHLENVCSNRSLRYAAYKQFTWWVYKNLGKGNRRVIPSYVLWKIRDMFPEVDKQYVLYSEGKAD